MTQKINLKLGHSVENAVHISSQDTLHIAFSKMTGSPLSSAQWLKAQSLNLTWMELKRELSMKYSTIPFDSHAQPKLLPSCNKVQTNSLTCICTAQVSIYQIITIHQLCLRFWWKAKTIIHWSVAWVAEGERQCWRTPEHIMENNGESLQRYLYYWYCVQKSQRLLQSWLQCPRNINNHWGQDHKETRTMLQMQQTPLPKQLHKL